MRLIATDLDGTLLNEDHEVSKENAQAIQKAKDHGIEFVVATGRTYNAAKKPLEKVGITCPIICLNGANIYTENETLIRSVPLEKETVQKIQQTCEEHNLYFEAFTNQGGFSTDREKFVRVLVDILTSANPSLKREDVAIMARQRFQDEEIEVIDHFEELFSRPDLDVYKILAFSITSDKLQQAHDQLGNEKGIAITSSGDRNLEFNHPNAQKGLALQLYSEQLGIEMKDVMALGDNYNDVSMLEMSGLGVAMGNADETIKNLSNFTTKSNIENGVAFAIEELLKNNIG